MGKGRKWKDRERADMGREEEKGRKRTEKRKRR